MPIGPFTIVAIYIVCWWVVLFAVLHRCVVIHVQSFGMRNRLIISDPDAANTSTNGCSVKPA